MKRPDAEEQSTLLPTTPRHNNEIPSKAPIQSEIVVSLGPLSKKMITRGGKKTPIKKALPKEDQSQRLKLLSFTFDSAKKIRRKIRKLTAIEKKIIVFSKALVIHFLHKKKHQ